MPESNIPDNKPRNVPGHCITVTNETNEAFDEELIKRAAEHVVGEVELNKCQISIAIVDDDIIHELNRKYLEHDYPTDVLSFPLEHDLPAGILAGEIVVSADTANVNASEYGWEPQKELTLYVIHGCLHLIGYDDHSENDRSEMRAAEQRVLSRLGICLPGAQLNHHLRHEEEN